MRILTVLLQYPPLRRIGAELYDHELHKALTKEGHSVEVVTTEEGAKDVPAWQFEGISVNAPITGEYDLILTHVDLRQKAWFVARLNNLTHLPIIAIHHNNAPSTIMAEKLYRWQGVIYNSEHARSLGSTPAPKTVLIPPVKPVGKTAVSTGDKIVQVGLNTVKGGNIFWNIAKANPDKEFIAVDGGWGKAVAQHKTPDNVTLLPHQEDLTHVWKQTGLLLLPSQAVESWAMVAAEAGRYGIQTFTFDDIHGVLENIGDSGFTAPRSSQPTLPTEYKPNKATQHHFNKQAILHRKQLKETITFLEGFIK
jgi:glycosyltransferase involved in cell wall biosynthesis